MAKNKYYSEDTAVSETGKWNTSKQYSELMIMKPLYECNEYMKICFHGTSELIDEFITSEDDKVRAKLSALDRYITTLKMLITNSIGHVQPTNMKPLKYYQTQLSVLQNATGSLRIIKTVQGTHGTTQWIEIKGQPYYFILDELIKINEDLTRILTEESMIFYKSEEFDMDKARETFMNKFVEEG